MSSLIGHSNEQAGKCSVNLSLVYGRIGKKTQHNTVISKRLFIQKPTQTNTTGLLQAPHVGPPGVKLFSKLNSS